jgi:UDPglucose 6-dehydrogenase
MPVEKLECPDTDDMREAPSLTLIGQLLDAGATVAAHDPVALNEAKRILGDRITYELLMYDALSGADALVLVTNRKSEPFTHRSPR